jgi:hypothetical protein
MMAKPLVTAAARHFVLYDMAVRGIPAEPDTGTTLLVDDKELIVRARTERSSKDGWIMNERHERIVDPSVFYAFVDLEPAPKDLPEIFIIPSNIVADALTKEHSAWLETPRLRGEGDKIDNPIRRILPAYRHEVEGYPAGWMEPYRGRWDLLTE